jgi:hypothetical protein
MKMRHVILYAAVFALIALSSQGAKGSSIILDGETPATGSNLKTTPLVTPFGTITFVGTVLPQYDGDMPAGRTFSTDNGVVPGTSGSTIEVAEFNFSFDVQSATFIYGGNTGTFSIQARDISSNVVAQFFQANTSSSQPIGPVTLSGSGIRQLRFEDTDLVLANIDNVGLVAVPEPSCVVLLFLAAGAIALVSKRSAPRHR